MIDAIVKEAKLNKKYLKDETVETIYFGGGTPSLVTAESIKTILSALKKQFTVSEKAEVTLEANPDDISEENLIAWKELGINRLSLGIQSFFDEDLSWMNRVHNAEQATEALKLVMQHFKNVTIDLIYGIPTLTDEKWAQNLKTALSFGVPHLSCYALTVEPRTALQFLIEKQHRSDVDEEKQAAHFDIMVKALSKAGFEHYEISNFSKPGFRSKHNTGYWQGKSYLGLGPAAHSFNGKSRQWNFENNAVYMKNIETGTLPFDKEDLTPTQQLNEYIMTAIRTIEGISLKHVEKTFGKEELKTLLARCAGRLKQKHIEQTADAIVLSKKGKFLADGVAVDLFKEEGEETV